MNDLSMHDATREFVLVGTQHSSDLITALSQEKKKSKALEDNMKELDEECKRADGLLYRMIPKKVADRLRNGESTISLCEVKNEQIYFQTELILILLSVYKVFSSCTILFSDVVEFTSTCAQMAPLEVVTFLNEMYTKFDKTLENHNVYKVCCFFY
jgi:hypothetical protein